MLELVVQKDAHIMIATLGMAQIQELVRVDTMAVLGKVQEIVRILLTMELV